MLKVSVNMLRTGRAGATTALLRLRLGGRSSEGGNKGRQRRWFQYNTPGSTSALSSLSPPMSISDSRDRGEGLTARSVSATLLSSHRHHQLTPHRSLGMYRRPHQRNLRDPSAGDDDFNGDESPNVFTTADDMETYDFLSDNYDNFHPLEDDDAFQRASRSDGADDDGYDEDDEGDDEDERMRRDLESERKAQAVRDELDKRTGRLWTDEWDITDQDWFEGKKFDDLPDWNPELCSRVSLERVKVIEGGIPTLSTLSTLPLPPPQPPHPSSSNPKPYTKHSRRSVRSEIQAAVDAAVANRVKGIMELETWEEKQDAVDELFESVEAELRQSDKGRMAVLAAQPSFGDWVEAAVERHLRSVVKSAPEDGNTVESTSNVVTEGEESASDDTGVNGSSSDVEASGRPTREQDEAAAPVFMDVLGSDDEGRVAPSVVHPLKPHHKEGTGRMVEEWDLAANKTTKRIMTRQCVRDIAETLDEAGKEGSNGGVNRVYVKGKKGVGKTAALAAIVASARKSGQVVLYLPDGDRLRKLGFYIRPNHHREGLYDLPVLAQEVCGQLLESHGKNLEGMAVDTEQAAKYLSEDELRRLTPEDVEEVPDSLTLVDLLKAGSESTTLSSGCYSAVVDLLMNQTDKPFAVVMDGFNCYFDHGHYFHEKYDPDVIKAIPFQRITLFKPLLKAMGVEKAETRKGLCRTVEPTPIRRGAIVVGTTESHAVARRFTDALSDAMEALKGDDGVKVVEVLPFSPVEVEHILANFEIIGVGRLRFDRGSTVMDDQEVAYLRMVSGSVGQNLLDACIL